ncbi:MAG: Fic family protein [Deltaproteobacteria bacterium]|nr:Fic family protein [Deltaproteobacteria bacterium]
MSQIESPSRIEPCGIEPVSSAVSNLVAELISESAALGNRLHPRSASSLSHLIGLMNCYYSNLMEGHHTRPKDIERALNNELDVDPRRRDLQIEARAHVRIQQAIEGAFFQGTLQDPTSPEFVKGTHRSFYEEVPASFLDVPRNDGSHIRMTPGAFRLLPAHDIQVGRHQPPSSEHVAAFMDYFHQRFAIGRLGKFEKIVAIAIAHHRFNYIHPFMDGNGRVSRLMSHAMVLDAGIGAHGLWSISRGLARGIEDRSDYRRMMDRADAPREHDTDGRGNLSQRALTEFVEWFLRVALDQVAIMRRLFDLGVLSERLRNYVDDELRIPGGDGHVVAEVFRMGTVSRGEATRKFGKSERAGRDALRQLLNHGILGSDTPKGDVHVVFSAASAEHLFPQLFPADAG